MSASEKLNAMRGALILRRTNAEQFVRTDRALRAALPQIVAVVEAAEGSGICRICDELKWKHKPGCALAALDKALTPKEE